MSGTLNCPSCGHDRTEVKDSRASDGAIRRRRTCSSCAHKFTTFEEVREAQAQDTYKFRRANEVREVIERLSLDDANMVLAMARRLAGVDSAADTEDSLPSFMRGRAA